MHCIVAVDRSARNTINLVPQNVAIVGIVHRLDHELLGPLDIKHAAAYTDDGNEEPTVQRDCDCIRWRESSRWPTAVE